MQMSL